MSERLLTAREVAEFLGLSTESVLGGGVPARSPATGSPATSFGSTRPISTRGSRSAAQTTPTVRRAGPVRRRQLPPARMGPGDRRSRDREAREDLRPPLDVRLERARRRDHDVRAGTNHGHQREDDRAALRHADRHRARRHPSTLGGITWMTAPRRSSCPTASVRGRCPRCFGRRSATDSSASSSLCPPPLLRPLQTAHRRPACRPARAEQRDASPELPVAS